MSTDSPKSTLVGVTKILEDLAKNPPKPPTDDEKKKAELQRLSDEEKQSQAVEWRYQGIGVPAIARAFDVDVRTVYRWIARAKREFRERLEGERPADILAEHLDFFERMESMCLYEASQTGKDGHQLDKKTGKIVKLKDGIGVRVRQDWLRMAFTMRDKSVKLLQDTGIIPNELSELYRTMADKGKIEEAEKGPKKQRSRNELIKAMLDRMDGALEI